jgi:elongation factor G
MPVYTTEAIRNVVLLSHSGAGKTSLSEAMLFSSGVISRLGRVDNGTTTSDHEPEEIKRHISLNLSLLPLPWDDKKINLIDTPGYPDFVAEVKAGMRVADGAIIAVCAASGVEVGTEQVWKYTESAIIPRLIFINKMERENANFYYTLEELQSKFGRGFVPLHLPIGSYTNFQGIVDLIDGKAYTQAQGEGEEIPPMLEGEVQALREKLVEAVAEIDDDLMAKYLEGEEITPGEIHLALQKGVKGGKVVPVLAGSALQNIGIPQLLKAICEYLPSPKERGGIVATNPLAQQTEIIEPEVDSPLTTLAFKTSIDPYVGKLTYLRVYSSSLSSNSQVWNPAKGQAERIGQLFMLRGKNQEAVPQLIAGDIGSVAKLAATSSGDTLCAQSYPLLLSPMESFTPFFSVALYPKTKADVDKLGTALPKLIEEDPSLQVRKEADTGEILLVGIGDSHVEVAIEKLQRKFGIGIEAKLPKVPYKETIIVPTKAEYKHKKQTGGHGQYGHVFLELEPLDRGSGFEFTERVVGGAVPKNYIPAIEKGVLEARQEGILAGYPVVDVRVTLYDGSYHPVDSSDISFKIAGAHALKKGLSQGQPALLEPFMRLQVIIPEVFTGDVVSDLNTKRARVLGMSPQNGNQVIEAHVPLAESLRYAIDLKSITQGRGNYTQEFSHYEEVPPHLVQKIIEERTAEKG